MKYKIARMEKIVEFTVEVKIKQAAIDCVSETPNASAEENYKICNA